MPTNVRVAVVLLATAGVLSLATDGFPVVVSLVPCSPGCLLGESPISSLIALAIHFFVPVACAVIALRLATVGAGAGVSLAALVVAYLFTSNALPPMTGSVPPLTLAMVALLAGVPFLVRPPIGPTALWWRLAWLAAMALLVAQWVSGTATYGNHPLGYDYGHYLVGAVTLAGSGVLGGLLARRAARMASA